MFSAAAALAVFLVCNPDSVRAHGDLHERIEAVSAELTSRPEDPDLLFNRGSLYAQHGDHAAAIADFSRVEKITPAQDGLYFAKARSCFGLKDYRTALEELGRIPAPASEAGDVYLWRGRALAKLDQPLNAATNYRTAFAKLDHASPDLFIEFSRTIASAGTNHYPAAITGLDQGISKIGPVITLDLEALDLEVKIGRTDDALARVNRMLEKIPGMVSLLKRKGEILELSGSPMRAKAVYLEALAVIETLPTSRRGTDTNRQLETELRTKLDPQ